MSAACGKAGAIVSALAFNSLSQSIGTPAVLWSEFAFVFFPACTDCSPWQSSSAAVSLVPVSDMNPLLDCLPIHCLQLSRFSCPRSVGATQTSFTLRSCDKRQHKDSSSCYSQTLTGNGNNVPILNDTEHAQS